MYSNLKKKIKSNNKGFSLVEILAAVTILGILSVMAIASINLVLNKSKEEFYGEQENNMILATQTFFQNNRNELPKKIGGRKKIYLKTLAASKYIDPIKDKNKKECDMERSYVEVFKFSQNSYKYKVKLICPGEHETKINNKDINPKINIDLPTGDKQKEEKDIEAIINLKAVDSDDSEYEDVKLISYNYIIFIKMPGATQFQEAKNTGSVKIRAKTKQIKISLDKYIPAEVVIQVTAINDEGGETTITSSSNYSDQIPPVCGRITGEGTTWSSEPERRITVQCNDTDTKGSGCTRPYFTKVFTEEAYYRYIEIKDKRQNTWNCPVSVMIDRTSPTLKINIRKKNASGAIIKTIVADNATPNQTYNTGWINKSVTTEGLYFEYVVSDTVGLKKLEFKKNAEGLKETASNVNTYGATTTVDLEKPITNDSIETSTEKSGELYTITKDGYNKMVVSATDLSGKKVTINLTAPYDVTTPSATVTVYDRKSDGSNGTQINTWTVNNTTSEITVAPTKWFNNSVSGVAMTIDLTDNLSGLADTSSQRWTTNETNTSFLDNPTYGDSSTYDITDGRSTHSWTGNGYRQSEYIAKDKAGNQIVVNTRFKIDSAAPAKPSSVTNSSGGNCTTSNIAIGAKTTEKISGIKKWQYKFGSGSWNDKSITTTSFSHTVTNNHDATMYIRAIDNAGNISESATTTVKKKSSCLVAGSCNYRSAYVSNVGYSWHCTCGASHTAGYIHFCVNSSGQKCVRWALGVVASYPECQSLNEFAFFCPNSTPSSTYQVVSY